jgi:hypothetical protein
MGVLSDMVIADKSEAEAIGASSNPTAEWDGAAWKTIDPVKLGKLWSILKSEPIELDGVMANVHRIQLLHEVSDDGPWVYLLPDELRDALADLSGDEPDVMQKTANIWGGTEELRQWDQSDVEGVLQEMADLADTAQLKDKSLRLWVCL